MPVFKAYDVRGAYPSEIDEGFARKLGYTTARFLRGGRIAVGRDVRRSAPAIAAAVVEGLVAAGVQATDLGIVTTPMLSYTVGRHEFDGGIMVTASHNPPGDIGFKICGAQARPVGEATGLREIEASMELGGSPGRGRVESLDPVPLYREHLRSFLTHVPPLRVAVDCANGAVGVHFDALFGDVPGISWTRLCFAPDGNFPNHPPDPLRDENVRDLREVLQRGGADLGVAFDGDGDRCMFFQSDGTRIGSDLITVLLAGAELRRQPGSSIVYDLRSSHIVREEILRLGGRPLRERVGHAFLKERMRRENALFGGELSGHFYFRDHYYADSGLLAFVKLLDLLGTEKRRVEDLLTPLRRTVATGEVNFRVADKAALLRRIRTEFSDGRIDELDGITVEYEDWWFNVRASNTEPLLRLNVEAKSAPRLADGRERLLEILGTPQ